MTRAARPWHRVVADAAAVFLVALPAIAAMPTGADAAESAPATTSRATATLISDTDAIAPGTPFHIALRLRVAPGWHTYWRNPGDAGAPPELSLTLSPGLAAGPIAFPAPDRQPEGPLMTYGYSGEVILPVTVAPSEAARTGAPATMRAHASWLVCANICVPEEGSFQLSLPIGTPGPSAQAPLFRAAAARTPRPAPWSATIASDGTLAVAGPEITAAAIRDAWFIPDDYGTVDGSAAAPLSVRDGRLCLALKPGSAFQPTSELHGIIAVRDRAGLTSFYTVAAAPGGEADSVVPFSRAVWLAFLGGLILNLMPCVFPVLAMKALALVRLSTTDRRHAWTHAVAYAAGVVATFLALAFALLALRGAGSAVGWGFQFQWPAFVAAMAWLLFAVGLNFAGVFAIGSGPAGLGRALAARGGHVGSFATGLLAVLVATPCTAPFMAVAIGAALTASVAETIAVFVAMGIGLALPYVVLATLPGLARRLPRPGRWMEVLRIVLSVPMFAAAAWLVWVVSAEAGTSDTALALAGIAGVAAFASALRRAQQGPARRLAHVAMAGAVVVVVGIMGAIVATPQMPAVDPTEAGAEAFTAARLAALRQEGRPVFVNMTAAWCVTCLVNERVALSTTAVRQAFEQRQVAYLKGDWTRQNPEISAFLHDHGRDGVPLYVFFPPAQRAPEVLPQILTPDSVLATVSGSTAG